MAERMKSRNEVSVAVLKALGLPTHLVSKAVITFDASTEITAELTMWSASPADGELEAISTRYRVIAEPID